MEVLQTRTWPFAGQNLRLSSMFSSLSGPEYPPMVNAMVSATTVAISPCAPARSQWITLSCTISLPMRALRGVGRPPLDDTDFVCHRPSAAPSKAYDEARPAPDPRGRHHRQNANDSMKFGDITALRPSDCLKCVDGWICEQHVDQPWPHGDCPGPGMPCDATGCVQDRLDAQRAESRFGWLGTPAERPDPMLPSCASSGACAV
jgi:hypothetical protein